MVMLDRNILADAPCSDLPLIHASDRLSAVDSKTVRSLRAAYTSENQQAGDL